MKKAITMLLVLAGLLFICTGISRAQGVDLLGVIFKLQAMRDDAAADIQRYTSEIYKCSATIGKCENIIRLARQKGNAEAERIAGTALTKAGQAKLKNEELKNSAELRKRKAEIALANVRNLLAKQSDEKAEIRSVVTGLTGRAVIFSKRLNESIPVKDTSAAFLEPGDEIWTYGNSSAEMQFLDGRGTLTLGEYSRFRMEEDKQGKQTINILKGKIYVGLDKLDDYRKMMEEKIKTYKEDAATVKDEVIQKIVDKYEEKKDRYEKLKSGRYHSMEPMGGLLWSDRPLIRTPCAVAAERGTKFLVFEDEKAGTELIVLEGGVDVNAIKGNESASVDAGYRIRVTKDGVISKPVKIDLEKIKRWWER